VIVYIYLSNSFFDSIYYLKVGPIYITEFLLLLIFIFHLPRTLRFYKKRFSRLLTVYAFVAVIAVINLFRGIEYGADAFRDAALFFYPILFLILVPYSSKIIPKRMLEVLILCSIMLMVSIITSFSQAVGSLNFLQIPRFAGARQAGLLTLGLISSVIYYNNFKHTRALKLLIFLQVVFISLTTLVTRNVIIAYSIMLFFLLMKMAELRKYLVRKLWLVILIVAVVIFSNNMLDQYYGFDVLGAIVNRVEEGHDLEEGTQGWRLMMWRNGIYNTTMNNFIIGNPLGSSTGYSEYDEKYNTIIRAQFHNGFVAIYNYSGMLGFLLFLIFFKNIFSRSIKDRDTTVSLISAAGIFYMVISAFNVILESPQSALPFWFTMWLIFSINKKILLMEPGVEKSIL